MNSVSQAMLWELWRTSRGELSARIALQCLVVLSFSLAGERLPDMMNTALVHGVFVSMWIAGAVFSSSWLLELDREKVGFSFRLGFTRPVTTTHLVMVPLLFTVVMACLSFVIPAALFSAVCGTYPAILGPTLLVACLVTCFMSATWSPTTQLGKVAGLAMVALGTVVSAALAAHTRTTDTPFLLELGKPEFYAYTWYQYLALLLISASAATLTIYAVEQQRHGESIEPDLQSWWRGRGQATNDRLALQPFGNRLIAQCWYEYRRFGYFTLLFAAVLPVLVLALATAGELTAEPRWRGAPVMWLGALLACPFVYQLIAADGAVGLRRRQGAFKFPAFDATRAMANDRLIACKLVVIAGCSIAGCLWMIVVAAIHAVATNQLDAWAYYFELAGGLAVQIPWYWWLVVPPILVLSYVSSSAFFLTVGFWYPLYPRTSFTLLSMGMIHIVLAVWDSSRDWSLSTFWVAEGYVIAAAVFLISGFALWTAFRSGFLGWQLFLASLALWSVYLGTLVAVAIKVATLVTIPPVLFALAGALAVVPLASTAIAPVALASHRHG